MEGVGVMSEERVITTTSAKGIDENSFPYKLFQKAKKFGIWNPSDIDFTQDTKDWKSMKPEKRRDILRLISQFQAGEEAVTLDLLPLFYLFFSFRQSDSSPRSSRLPLTSSLVKHRQLDRLQNPHRTYTAMDYGGASNDRNKKGHP